MNKLFWVPKTNFRLWSVEVITFNHCAYCSTSGISVYKRSNINFIHFPYFSFIKEILRPPITFSIRENSEPSHNYYFFEIKNLNSNGQIIHLFLLRASYR